MTHANEYTLAEKPILDRLKAHGYRTIHPDEHPILRPRENEVLFKPLLVATLVRINDIPQDTARTNRRHGANKGHRLIVDYIGVSKRERALDEVDRFGHRHETTLGVQATGYRLSDARSRWGSCGQDQVIRIHWRLVQAPTPALEYVVAHEVVHLAHRNHSPEFWATLSRTLPDWAERKAMLERWELDLRAFLKDARNAIGSSDSAR
ncbi:MAG: YgjP-like metallopeptidase domain-containing protein [Pseudomonadota bacterium]